ncbi:transporter substrate-binding domain-containing protein [Streptomyces sp. SID3212]|uniref:transporter substrate-binding domain-containing protein n=1 Tax=Streptomyces sp. SID3212 TaxID=2690259 RepID=UPI00136CCE80|nr:transporter substrate-binding domain-containing protein [Streptomyces sp. SID3212]MYV56636.1 transporter substrate-binding domain-containing protein [Streptomyces sp. SID3212]
MKTLSRLCLLALTVAALGSAACSPDRTPKHAPISPATPTTTPGGDPSPTTSGGDPLFPKNVFIGSKVDQPGFNVYTDHTWVGFEAELSAYLGRKLNFTPQYHDVPSAQREKVLQEEVVELVIATYSITPERAKLVDFVGPYLKTRQGLLVKKGDHRIRTVNDTAGKQICTVKGSTSAPEEGKSNPTAGQGNYLHKDAHFVHLSDYQACVDDVRAGNSHAVWTDIPILYGYTEAGGVPMEVVSGIEVGKIQLYGIGIAKEKDLDMSLEQNRHQPERCRALEGALKTFLQNEWYERFRVRFENLTKANPDFEATYKPTEDEVSLNTTCG